MTTEALEIPIQENAVANPLWKRFLRERAGVLGAAIVLLLCVLCVFANVITDRGPDVQGDLLTERYLAPSLEHPFGTDKFGRELLSRVLHGGRTSLAIATSVVVFSLTIGIFYGLTAGYVGGWADALMMRLLDFLLAFPIIFLAIAIVALYQPTHWYLVPLLSFSSWMDTARLVRAEVLSLKAREFVLAARGLGLSRARILLVHILPNCLTPVLVSAPLKIGEIILLESALSYLGVGVQPPTASWGNIINDGKDVLLQHWWVAGIAGFFIVATVMGFNLIGEGVRRAFDSRR